MKRALVLAAVAALAVASATVGHATSGKEIILLPKCPSHAPKFESQNLNSWHFVRPRASLVRLCRYYNINWGDSQGLWRHHLVQNSATIARLTRAFNKLKEPPRGIFCVRDDGSEMLLVFGYAGASPERVVVKLSGCRFASNGRSTRSTTAKLHNRLLALTRG